MLLSISYFVLSSVFVRLSFEHLCFIFFIGKHQLKPQGKNHDQVSHIHLKCSPGLR